jgi:cold shock CspA family protein
VARNGNIRARRIKLLKGASSLELYQGVVCSLKDNYGFIERADIVKEIFFHFSEFQDDIQSLTLGDDVQYAIQTRNVSSWNGMCAVVISL